MIRSLGKLFSDCRGATAVEYGLIIGLIALACVGALASLASGSTAMWNNVSTSVRNAG